MKQFQIQYKKEYALNAWLGQIRSYCGEHHISQESLLFRIYSDTTDSRVLTPLLDTLKQTFPEAAYAGSSSNGNIIHGSLGDAHVALTCTLFEHPETKVQVIQLPMDFASQEASAAVLLECIRKAGWVKAVEMMTTLGQVDMLTFCRALSAADPAVTIYGGGAMASDVQAGDTSDTFVFSGSGTPMPHSAVFILQGGPAFHVKTLSLTGWEKLGRPFQVTASSKNLLLELDHQPALEVYQKYLDIPLDERFYRMANIFPLSFEAEDASFLRVVTSWTEEGALKLGSFIRDQLSCHIAYGDLSRILKSLGDALVQVQEFRPDAIQLFSCTARKYFWGAHSVSQETLPFESLAPTSGFYTSGEFSRSGKQVLLHNITLVIAAFREGEPPEEKKEVHLGREEVSSQMQVSRCLATYIDALTKEFEDNPDT